MPIYVLRCRECASQAEVLLCAHEALPRCHCGGETSRVPQVVSGYIPPHLRDENYEGRVRQREWIASPEAQAKLKSGQLTTGRPWV